jgi:hypothetical protein
MKLRHFSNRAIAKLHDVERQRSHMKPRGLWISDEADHGWRAWCEAEDYGHRDGCFDYEYAITLDPKAKVLIIDNSLDLYKFTQEYRAKDDIANKCIAHIGPEPDTIHIDWDAVAAKYDGIIITPYLWGSRLDHRMSWYYGWDCASGCIWKASAIKLIKEIKHAEASKKD